MLFHQPVDKGADGHGSKPALVPYKNSLFAAHAERCDRELQLLIESFKESACAATWLPFQVDQDTFRVLVEAVLHEPVEHTAGLDRQDELRVRFDELYFLLLDVVWNRIAGIADVIAAVDPLSIAVPGDLLDRQVPDDARAALLRTEFEVLSEELRDDLEVFREEVRFLLGVELRDVPAFGDVVHLPQRRRLAVPDHVPNELEDVHRPQEHESALQLLRAAHAHQVAVLPDRVLRVEADVRLRPQGDLHLRDLPAVEFLVDLFRDGIERVHSLAGCRRAALLFTRHRAPLPSRRSRSRPLPPAPRRATLPLRTRRSSAPNRRAAAPRPSRGWG